MSLFLSMLKKRPVRTPLMAAVAACLVLTGCDLLGVNSSEVGADVSIGFSVASSPEGSASTSTQASSTTASDDGSLSFEGTNGTLTISDLRFIVEEFELDGNDATEDVEAPPGFVSLPLDAAEVEPVARKEIPAGHYTELEFEVEDLDLDEDESEGEHEQLTSAIRADFPEWPDKASMVVVGSFTPEGGEPQAFTTYFEAEIEVELDLEPPLEVTADGPSRAVKVRLDPMQWFLQADGSVLDLSQYDYEKTDELPEFEAEFENGVAEIEFDDD